MRTIKSSLQLSVERLNNKSTANCTSKEVDKLLTNLRDVINPEFTSWYCKATYKLGVQQVAELAVKARAGDNPAHYFSFLIKKQLSA